MNPVTAELGNGGKEEQPLKRGPLRGFVGVPRTTKPTPQTVPGPALRHRSHQQPFDPAFNHNLFKANNTIAHKKVDKNQNGWKGSRRKEKGRQGSVKCGLDDKLQVERNLN